MNLLDWLGGQVEGAFAQANPWDNGADYNSVQQRRRKEEQARAQRPPRAPQVGVNAVRPLLVQSTPLPKVSQAQISQRSVANQFNPLKTVGDVAGGIGKGINDVATAVGGFVLPGTAKLTNQTLGIVENTGANIAGETQKLFGDKKGGQNTIDSVKRHVDQNLLAQGKGLFGQGGIYNSTDSLHNANPTEVLKKADDTGLIGKDINDIATAIGGFVLPGTAKFTNQTLGIIENTGANIAGETQKLFGDKKGGQNTIDSVKRHVDQNLLGQGKGLFGQGGIYNSTDSLHNANPTEVLRKAGGTGLEVAGELLPVVRVAKGPTLGAKITNNSIAGAVSNALADVGSQYVQNGTVNLWQTAQSAAFGGAFGSAIPMIGAVVKPIGTKLVQTGQRAQNFGLLPPTKLTPEELFAAKKMRQAQQGLIDPRTVTTQDAILNNRAEKKLGQSPGTPQAYFAKADKAHQQLTDLYNQAHSQPTPKVEATQPTVAPKGAPIEKTPQVGKPDPTAALKQEALKYKSADEFVKAQGDTHYHGSNQDLSTLDFNRKAPKGNELPYGVHFTQDKQLAGDFANGSTKGAPMSGKVSEAQVITKKPFDARKLVNREGEPNYAILKEIADKSGIKGYPEHYGPYGYTMTPHAGSTRAIDTKTVLDNAKPAVIRAVLKEHGYDPAIKYSMKGSSDPMGGGAPVYTDAIAVLDKNLVKTKQQLTDLYNQAHAKAPTPQAPKAKQPEVGKTLKDGELYSTANSYISFGSDSTGGVISYSPKGTGHVPERISYNKLSQKTRNELVSAELEYKNARANSAGPVAPGTVTETQTARRRLEVAQSNAIEELGLQEHASIQGARLADGTRPTVQKPFLDRYTDWLENKWKSKEYSDAQIQDMEANPSKYKAQFESETSANSPEISQLQQKVDAARADLNNPQVDSRFAHEQLAKAQRGLDQAHAETKTPAPQAPKAEAPDPTANKQNVNNYTKANKELKTAIDARINETNPELFHTEATGRTLSETGASIPSIHVDDLKRYFGHTEDFPAKYKRTTGRADLDELAREAGFDDVDNYVEAIQQELGTRSKGRENAQMLRDLRNDPTIIDDARKSLADEKARYGTPDTFEPSARDLREADKMNRPQVESTSRRVERALDPNDKLQYKNLNPVEKKLYQGEKAKQKVAQAEVQKTKAKESLRETKIQKLLDERQRAIFAGQDDHVAAYDQELRKLGHDVSTDASPTATVSRDNAPQEPQPQGRQDNRTTQENVNRSSQRSARQAPSTDKKARTDRTYTDDNPDIDTEQYVKDMTDAQKAAQKGEKGYSKFKSDAKEKFIDDLSPIEDRLRKAINDGAQVDPKDHITYQLDRSRRSEGVMNAYVRDNGLDKIIQNVPDPNEFDQYLIARHAKELDPEITTGRNAKADAALVKKLDAKYGEHAKKLYAYNQKLLDTSVEYGLISKASAAALKKQYPDYVPFNRIFNEDELANLYGGSGKGNASLSSQNVVRGIKGSKRAIASPLNSIIDKTRVVIEQGERNRAAKMLADYRQLPGNPFNLREIRNGEEIGNKSTVSFLDNGKKRTFETDREIADAAKNMTRQDIGLWGRIAAIPARVLRGGATTVNVGFAGANIVKDVIGAAINSRHPFRIADPEAFGKALAAALNHNGEHYQELMREGVAGTSFDMYRNPLKSNIGEIRSQKNFGTRALHNLRPDRWYRTLENAIGRSEDFGRALQYYSNKKGFEGKYGSGSKQAKILAADQARNNSTNFFRHGSYGKGINLAIPYWNAGVQGARIQTRRIVERPVQTIAKIGFTVAAPSAMIAANNYSTEKNRQVMEDIPQYEKDGNIIIVGPDAKRNEETGRWEGVFKIPVPPQHIGVHKTIQDAVKSGFTGKPMDVVSDLGRIAEDYTTVNPTSLKETANRYIPQALKLVAEPMTNTNFFTGNKIVPDSQKNLPAKDQYNDYTSGTAKTIGNLTNISPRQIDNAIRTGMGGAGQNLVNILDNGLAAAGIIDKKDVKGQNAIDSITRRFYGAASINPSEKADEMFGEMKKKITETDAYKNASQYDKGRMLNRLESDISAVSWHVSGKSDSDDKLSKKQKSLLVDGFNADNYTNLDTSTGGVEINKNVGKDSKATLTKYNDMSSDDRKKWFNSENDAEYKYNLAKYENAKANGTLSTADDIRTKRSVYKDKVGSSYSKNVREMYTLSKTELADYLNTEDGTDKAKLYDELYAYDRALYDAGLVSSLKFKYGLSGKKGGKSGKKGGKKGNGVTEGKAMVSLARQLNKLTTPKTTGSKSPAAGIKLPQLKKTALRKYTVKTAKVQKAAKPLKIKTSKA